MSTRRRRVVVLVSIAVVSSLVGVLAGRFLVPAAHVAANAEPPLASTITVPVERRVLTASVTARADVVRASSSEIGYPAANAGADGVAVVTSVPVAVGSEVAEGDVVVEVSGRPILVLEGSLPMYRDWRPGATGPDVEQLERALSRLGYDTGSADGVFDTALQEAVHALYRDRGFAPRQPPAEDQARLRGAAAAVRGAAARVADLERSIAESSSPPEGAERLRLDAMVASAEDALQHAELSLELSREQAEVRAQLADDAVATATSAEQRARRSWEEAEASGDQDEIDARRAELDRAAADLRAALRQHDLAARQSELDLAQAEAGLRQAQRHLTIERAARHDALHPAVPAHLRQELATAREELQRAHNEERVVATSVGATVPRGEVHFVPTLPSRIESVAVEPGDLVDGPLVTLAGERVVLRALVSAAQGALVAPGDEARIDVDLGDGDGVVVGSVVEVLRGPAAGEVALEIGVDERGQAVLGAFAGDNLRVEVPTASTDGEVLAVPFAAVTATADGRSRLRTLDASGATRDVVVDVGLRAGGLVEVTAVGGGLRAGDEVVVGGG